MKATTPAPDFTALAVHLGELHALSLKSLWRELEAQLAELDRRLGRFTVRDSERWMLVEIPGEDADHLRQRSSALRDQRAALRAVILSLTHGAAHEHRPHSG